MDAKPCSGWDVGAVESESLRIIVELEPGEPICGSLAREGEQRIPFEGMLGFLSAFDRLRAGDERRDDRPERPPEDQ